MHRTIILTVGLLFSIALTGCAGGGTSSAKPSASASASASAPTPKPIASSSTPSTTAGGAEAKPNRVVITAEGIQVVNDDETAGESFTYFEPIEDVVAGLSVLFGAPPVPTPYAGTSVDYNWDGFQIGTDGRGEAPFYSESVVKVRAATVHGLAIETVDGIQVGDPAAPLEAAHPETSHRWVLHGVDTLTISVGVVSLASGTDRTFAVELTAQPWDGAVSYFLAPHKNFE